MAAPVSPLSSSNRITDLAEMHISGLTGLKSVVINLYHSYFSLPNASNYADRCATMKRPNAVALDLGCGKTPRNPFHASDLFGVDLDYGVDIDNRIYSCDLGMEKLPFDSHHFDFITAFDLIEHIPRIVYKDGRRHSPFLCLMNEIHRTLKPGGVFLSHTPAYPKMAAFADPTHTNYITPMTFKMYFCAPHTWASRYGFNGAFQLHSQGWHGDNLVSMLVKSH